uniref:Uncharacterized protein n=1 Tax=Panagrolaimus davidi TaxID=227884 RepID=A0A914P990_9BILA
MSSRTHELFDAVTSQSIQGIVRLYASEQFVQADIRDHEGNTCLHIACRGGNVHVVRTILILFEHRFALAKKKNKIGLRPIEMTDNIEIKTF